MSTPSVNPSGRVQVIPNPIASPGQCGICGKSSHSDGFVAPDLNFEFYGTLIFCADCAREIGAAVGCWMPSELDDLRHQVDVQNDELGTLRKAILGLESAVDGLTNYRDATGVPLGNRGSARVDPPVQDVKPQPPATPADPPKPDPLPGDTPGGGKGGTQRFNEFTVIEGPDDVYDSDAVNELLGLDTDSQP